MAIKDFDFLSPGVQMREVDESALDTVPEDAGLVVISRAVKGPGMVPVRVKSVQAFEKIFTRDGEMLNPERVSNDDVWRDGNLNGAGYGLYAAKAWLESNTSPVTFIRLLGHDAPSSEQASSYKKAGWDLGGANNSTTVTANATAYGVFMLAKSNANAHVTGTLAAVLYATGAAVTINGTNGLGATTSSAGVLMQTLGTANTSNGAALKLDIWSAESTKSETFSCHFKSDTDAGGIRAKANTNPQMIKSVHYGSSKSYFLGETYPVAVQREVLDHSSSAGDQYAVILPLQQGSAATTNFLDHLGEAQAAKTGWIITKDPDPTTNAADYVAEDMKKLFRIVSLHEGSFIQEKYYIEIKIQSLGSAAYSGGVIPSKFSVSVREFGNDNIIEQHSNLTLDENDANFVGKRIGTARLVWNDTDKVFNSVGSYTNRSDWIRVEMASDWKNGISDKLMVPWGFYGPTRPRGFTILSGSTGPNFYGSEDNAGTTRKAEIVFASIPSGTVGPVAISGSATGWHTATTTYDYTKLAALRLTSSAGSVYTINFLPGLDQTTNEDVAFDNAAWATFWNTGSANLHTQGRTLLGVSNMVYKLLYAITASSEAAWEGVGPYERWNNPFNVDGSGSVRISVSASAAGPRHDVDGRMHGDVGENCGQVVVGAIGTDTDNSGYAYVREAKNLPHYETEASGAFVGGLPINFTASVRWPRLALTEEDYNNSANYEPSYGFGLDHKFKSDTGVANNPAQAKDFKDLVRFQGAYDVHGANGDALEYSFIFSLDDLVRQTGKELYYWASGSHAAKTAYTALNGSQALIDKDVNTIKIPFVGGFDGLDLTEVDPFSAQNVLSNYSNRGEHYAFASVVKAIDMLKNSEQLQADVIAAPGVTNTTLVRKLIDTAEDRKDCMAVVDYDDGYLETYENSGNDDTSNGTVSQAINAAKSALYDSSYAAAYYPRVRITGDGPEFVAPASIAAIGALAVTDIDGPWFAPAGFSRGALNPLGGSGQLKVSNVLKVCTKKNRDDLYAQHINPIAKFGAINEIVVFGQKTLLLSNATSALSRVNVRRLMIFLKNRIGRIADTILFQPSVEATFNVFNSRAKQVLEVLKGNNGITEYKIDLDESRSPDAIDRNIMYVKIYIKPARAIEFIAIDFIISRTSAEF